MSNEDLEKFALLGMTAQDGISTLSKSINQGNRTSSVVNNNQALNRDSEVSTTIREEAEKTRVFQKEILNARPTYYPTDQEGVKEWKEGNTKIKQTIKKQ